MEEPQNRNPEVDTSSLADRFSLSQSWSIASRLVRRHPQLLITRVVDPEKYPLLLVHDDSAELLVQFDLPASIQYAIGADGHRLSWEHVFAQADPNAVVRQIETDLGLAGPPPSDAADPKVLAYRTIACVLALGLDHPGTWEAVPARIDPMDPDACDWDLLTALPGGEGLAEAHLDRIVQRAQASEGLFTFHQPVWALVCDVAPVALLDVDGAVHTREAITDLRTAFATSGGSVAGLVGALLGPSLS